MADADTRNLLSGIDALDDHSHAVHRGRPHPSRQPLMAGRPSLSLAVHRALQLAIHQD